MRLDHRQSLDRASNSGALHFTLQLVRDPLQAFLLGRRHASLRIFREGILQDQVDRLLNTGPLGLQKSDLLLEIFKLFARSCSMLCALKYRSLGSQTKEQKGQDE